MRNQLKIDLSFDFKNKIRFGDNLLFIGSCFSESIGKKIQDAGFNAYLNPFGVIYHPLALAQLLEMAVENDGFIHRFVQNDDLFFDWSCSGTVYSTNRQNLKDELNSLYREFRTKIASSKVLFITFGTSYAYYLKEGNQLVANCHKSSNDNFYKSLVSIDEMEHKFKTITEKLLNLNKDLQIVYTVSPVRHIKDGLIENNRSKSRLLILCERLQKNPNSFYFPSYELIIDILRDYSFFKEDAVHPNEYAIDEVWNYFKTVFISLDQLEHLRQVENYNKTLQHKLLYPESKKSKEFLNRLKETRRNLLNQNPLIQI